MASHARHDYHILPPSVWPFVAAVSAFLMLLGMVLWFGAAQQGVPFLSILGLAGILFTMYVWWADTVREAHVGDHTPVVYIGLRYGFILFIISEVMFFLAWFWAYFRYALFTQPQTTDASHGVGFAEGGMFPPEGIHAVDPLAVGRDRDCGAPLSDGAWRRDEGKPERRAQIHDLGFGRNGYPWRYFHDVAGR